MLPLMTHCPICKALYPTEQVKLVLEQGNVKLFHSTCPSCSHGLFYYIVQDEAGVSAIGLITDANSDDALRLAQTQAVSAEDCILAHKIISGQSRDLCQNLLDMREKLA